ncbi:hypothetical protein EVAR_68378_1 [Eumeta japonica]|uniref:Uncharacterized protein n=1 Tax=Eumeta variegata TaxID=151549 RepID=A0A4C1ZTW6_EUMVA|nr:hypothetical protein EVAR_68378_1 [Eumeta japonica]
MGRVAAGTFTRGGARRGKGPRTRRNLAFSSGRAGGGAGRRPRSAVHSPRLLRRRFLLTSLTKQFTCRVCAAAVSLLLGRIGQWSGREIARSALSLERSAQAERDNESCFFVRAAGVHRFIRSYHVNNVKVCATNNVQREPNNSTIHTVSRLGGPVSFLSIGHVINYPPTGWSFISPPVPYLDDKENGHRCRPPRGKPAPLVTTPVTEIPYTSWIIYLAIPYNARIFAAVKSVAESVASVSNRNAGMRIALRVKVSCVVLYLFARSFLVIRSTFRVHKFYVNCLPTSFASVVGILYAEMIDETLTNEAKNKIRDVQASFAKRHRAIFDRESQNSLPFPRHEKTLQDSEKELSVEYSLQVICEKCIDTIGDRKLVQSFVPVSE